MKMGKKMKGKTLYQAYRKMNYFDLKAQGSSF